MKIKQANQKLYRLVQIMVLSGTLVVANVLFTMVTHRHIWSQKDVLNAQIASSIVDTKVEAERGTIYDRNHNIIAHEVNAYTMVAYLDTSIVDKEGHPNYVEDFKATADKISSVLEDVDADRIEKILKNAKKNEQIQTELGAGTKRISKEKKDAICALNLPGISFIDSTKREYPVTPFSSNLIGFAAYDEDAKKIVGKMGLEQSMEKYLGGKDGHVRYQKTVDGSILPGTMQVYKEAENGKNVVLTLDATLQAVVEKELQETMTNNKAKSAWCLVMEVETGKVLSWASYPTFNQNEYKEIPSYTDQISEAVYEPGSVMKAFTYATAIDTGVYPKNKSFFSGEFWYVFDTNIQKIIRIQKGESTPYPKIADAMGKDFGTITFDDGFAFSSNVGICELLSNYINYNSFNEYLDRFGFFKPVNSPFVHELINRDGSVGIKHTGLPTDYLSTGFGQSSSVTALQLCQAYTSIFNDGNMMRPYVVEAIENAETNKIEKKYNPKVVGSPISKDTANQMKDLMKGVMEEGKTGNRFNIDGVDVIAKTGTGEVWDTESNDYDEYNYTSSVMAAAPYEDPKIMVYWGMVSPNYLNFSVEPFKNIMKSALIANGVSTNSQSEEDEEVYEKWETYTMPSLVNHSIKYADDKMNGKKVHTFVIGNGKNIVDQYPKSGMIINSNDHVFLMTEGPVIKMPNMKGWTRKDITAFWQLTGISVEVTGYGKVKAQNIEEGKTIEKNTKIQVELE